MIVVDKFTIPGTCSVRKIRRRFIWVRLQHNRVRKFGWLVECGFLSDAVGRVQMVGEIATATYNIS